MEIVGGIFLLAGVLVSLFYGIIILIKAFQTSILWGLGSLFIPLVGLIFIILHWQITKQPFLRSLISIPLIIVGAMLMPQQM
ncbi:hypothetical protein [Zooshikella harenae]|uniref:Uncharacterized protein n=1 Tax=Zooshikella harenae TaxID=2827238 RepID=A0ABS5Z745_9GAMM|nr:hypothetical protein [Zooshikella harenae]MBU2709883.1 hypothetical protein [Zooshikella harenae]